MMYLSSAFLFDSILSNAPIIKWTVTNGAPVFPIGRELLDWGIN